PGDRAFDVGAARAHGLRIGRRRRHRRRARRRGRRAADRGRPGVRRGVPVVAAARCLRVHDPDPRAPRAAQRTVRHRGKGKGVKSVAERVAKLRPAAASSLAASLWPLIIGIAIAWALQQVVAPVLGPFKAKVLLDIGIAIVAAGSLNIVNGFGGQFSIGHAGFMMIGGYAAAWLTYYGSIQLWGTADVHGELLGGGDMLFLGACMLAGVVAAAAGFIVGMPSLRLRGDYLAIVTLGFGEIVRVLVQRTSDQLDVEGAQKAGLGSTITKLGGSLGFDGVPTYTRIFYVYMFVAILLIAA